MLALPMMLCALWLSPHLSLRNRDDTGGVQTCLGPLSAVFIATVCKLCGLKEAGSKASVVWIRSPCAWDPQKSLATPRLFIPRQKAKKTHWKEALPLHQWGEPDEEILTTRPHRIIKVNWFPVLSHPQYQLNVPIIWTALLKV